MVKKFIKNSICLGIVLMGIHLSSFAQLSKVLAEWNDSTLILANTAKGSEFMSKKEQDVVFFINLARNSPSFFNETIVKYYLDSSDTKKDKYVKELMTTLESTSPMPMLEPQRDLYETALKHAKDMGETGRTGHNASDGTTFRDRMGVFSQKYASVNENCNYGLQSALDIVMDLLIDQGIANAGHRKNILNPDSRYIGVSIQPHKRYGTNCVQDFAGAKL